MNIAAVFAPAAIRYPFAMLVIEDGTVTPSIKRAEQVDPAGGQRLSGHT